jgi:uncharacterized protein YjiS (DUF1127 family)
MCCFNDRPSSTVHSQLTTGGKVRQSKEFGAVWETSKLCRRSHPTFPGSSIIPPAALKEVEAAMNISTDGGQCGRRGGLNQVLTDWWQQLRSRHELESLDDTILRDIGLSRREERFEQSKPFWMN